MNLRFRRYGPKGDSLVSATSLLRDASLPQPIDNIVDLTTTLGATRRYACNGMKIGRILINSANVWPACSICLCSRKPRSDLRKSANSNCSYSSSACIPRQWPRSGRTMARCGLRMMPPFPSSPLSAGRRVFPSTAGRLAFQAGPTRYVRQVKPAPGMP